MPELNRSLNQQRNVSTPLAACRFSAKCNSRKKEMKERKKKPTTKPCFSGDALTADTKSSVKTTKTNVSVCFYGGLKVQKQHNERDGSTKSNTFQKCCRIICLNCTFLITKRGEKLGLCCFAWRLCPGVILFFLFAYFFLLRT